ncbi:poly(A)-binding protein [Reticulomyxa filosa]|uniref:Poly(A)-binding protein n=1 Tax=Reticulomyxa filosa TaxID=46433 RepID=X6NYV2_RETFI|nr:poly(A)-binding protein [Reticulomyxa filosa]|eukprot:ETO30447.1 poly(A)-binding protein [Reticulomyxa filosa]
MYKMEREKFKLNEKSGGVVQTSFAVYVGNVPNLLTDEQLYQLFSPFGNVLSTTVLQKTEDYKYGFVNFECADDAAKALLHMNGKIIGGKTLQVKPATKDVTKAVAISQAASSAHENTSTVLFCFVLFCLSACLFFAQYQMETMRQQLGTTSNEENRVPMDLIDAEATLTDGKNIKVWKVQCGEEWHEYDMSLAGIVEGLIVGQQVQVTLPDSNYGITRLSATEALQQNLSTGTTRKVMRITREKKIPTKN